MDLEVSAHNDGAEAEYLQYFYHSDHASTGLSTGLGSASFVTDATGYVDQHIQYLPFGELFISQRNSTFDSRYKFTAKELDNETQYTYFGARYLDSEISIWLSVDPLAQDYPNLSCYMYVAGNPIRLHDPDGRKIYDGENEVQVSYDANGTPIFSLADGGAVSSQFMQNGGRLINAMAKTPTGKDAINSLIEMPTKVNITITQDREPQGMGYAKTDISLDGQDNEKYVTGEDGKLYAEQANIIIYEGEFFRGKKNNDYWNNETKSYAPVDEILNDCGVVEAFRLSPEQIEGWKNYKEKHGSYISLSSRGEYYRLENNANKISSKTQREYKLLNNKINE